MSKYLSEFDICLAIDRLYQLSKGWTKIQQKIIYFLGKIGSFTDKYKSSVEHYNITNETNELFQKKKA